MTPNQITTLSDEELYEREYKLRQTLDRMKKPGELEEALMLKAEIRRRAFLSLSENEQV